MALSQTDKFFLSRFFTVDMLENLALSRQLMDFQAQKPLECVGEKKEVWVALWNIYRLQKDTESPTIQYFMRHIYPQISDKIAEYEKEVISIHEVPISVPDEIRML